MLTKYKPNASDIADHYKFFNDKGEECGEFDIFTNRFGEKEFSIWNVCIYPNYRDKGLGQQMLRECIDMLKSEGINKLELTVRSENVRAYHIYQKLGFVKNIHPLIENPAYIPMEISLGV